MHHTPSEGDKQSHDEQSMQHCVNSSSLQLFCRDEMFYLGCWRWQASMISFLPIFYFGSGLVLCDPNWMAKPLDYYLLRTTWINTISDNFLPCWDLRKQGIPTPLSFSLAFPFFPRNTDKSLYFPAGNGPLIQAHWSVSCWWWIRGVLVVSDICLGLVPFLYSPPWPEAEER